MVFHASVVLFILLPSFPFVIPLPIHSQLNPHWIFSFMESVPCYLSFNSSWSLPHRPILQFFTLYTHSSKSIPLKLFFFKILTYQFTAIWPSFLYVIYHIHSYFIKISLNVHIMLWLVNILCHMPGTIRNFCLFSKFLQIQNKYSCLNEFISFLNYQVIFSPQWWQYMAFSEIMNIYIRL